MPLIVPLLRLSMLFLNVYDTFKTLKPPALSARTGRVSVRAASQRKRDMKGVLAIWIVWACFATYERTVDGMIRFFIPFYDEIKSLLILFLIVSRSRGAEPIYLHVIRPLVKPYVVTLDALLDVVHGVGDLLLLAGRIPIQVVSSWWHER
ncbi:hypothetical protein PUNSTDRAFT_28484, partial [Punctularia strigosozonata HHB-11173 SS5]|uniref:uncharacterized protein n=1 Tax=Punctularia strigosozonata (strain HHB-11173) TaxID=741275 RepID=UPI0004418350